MWRHDEDDDFTIPLTPLIDIVFLLLVFFLVATTFLDEQRDLVSRARSKRVKVQESEAKGMFNVE